MFGAKDLVSQARRIPPQWPMLAFMLAGLGLGLMSFLVDVADVRNPDGEQVGYIAAINWSVGFSVVFPLMLYFGLRAFQAFDRAIYQLARSKMFVDKEWNPVSDDKIYSKWRRALTKSAPWGAGFVWFGILVSLVEWVAGSGFPLWLNAPQTTEVDWSVAAVFQHADSVWYRLGNAILGIFAFIYQGIAIGFVMCFLVFIGLAANVIEKLAHTQRGIRLIPWLDSRDARRGFEHFEGVVDNTLLFGLFTFCFFFLSNIQNAYLHHEGDYKSLYDFTIGHIIHGASEGTMGKWEVMLAISELNYSFTAIVLSGFVVTFFVLMFVLFVLKQAASESRKSVRSYLISDAPESLPFTNLNLNEAKARLDSMVIWPISYMRVNLFLLIVASSLLCLVYYRIGLIFFGISIATALTMAIARINSIASPDKS